MANLLSTTVNGSLNVQGSSMYVTASQLHIGKASSGTAQMSFESWGSYTGAIAMNSSGAFHWGGQGNSEWYFKKNNTYNGDYSASGTTVLRIASDGNIYSAYYGDWLSNVFAGKVSTSGGSTIAGTTYFSGGESMQVYGIRGRFANEYIHLYNKVGIGNPNGWGEGQGSTPGYGLSTYGGAVFAYGNNATSAFYGHLRIDRNWALGDYGAEQFTIRGTYPSIALRSTQHNSKWLIHNDDTLSFYYGGTVDDNSWARKFFIPTDGNIWMSWAGDYISNLLGAKQNASTAITTSNIGSQSVNYANSAGDSTNLGGRSSSRYLYYRGINAASDFQTYQSSEGVIRFDQVNDYNTHSNPPGGYNYGGVLSMRGDNFGFQIWGSHIGDLYYKTQWGNDQYSGWRYIIHSGNIGSASVSYASSAGNADTVDSLHASVFVRNDIYNSAGAGLQVVRNIGTIDGSWPDASHTLGLENSDAGNIVVNFHRAGYTSNNLWYNGSQFRFDATTVSTSDFRAPIFYDSADTFYYVDPNSTSRLYRVGSYYLSNIAGVGDDHPYGLYFDSGLSTAYAIYRESGAWGSPFPDLRIAFHTGIKIGANASYEGVRFYTDYDMSSQVMSVNNGSDPLGGGNVYVNRSLQAGNSLRAPIFYDSDDTTYYGDFNSRSVLNSLQLGTAASDTSNLKLDVQGHMAIRGSNGLFFGVSTNNYNSWTTKIYASGSTQYFNAQSFIFDNQGYGGTTFVTINGSGIYNNFWYRNYGAQGMYNESYGTHFYSSTGAAWNITGSGGNIELRFRSNHESTIRGYVYADTSNQIGFLNNGGGWTLRTNSSNNAFVHGVELTINADGASYSNIIMNDGDEGNRIIHCNSNRIGFLNQSGSWGSWCYDDGGWGTDYAMYSPIYFDISNTNRYLDLNSTAADAMVISGGIHISRDNVTGNGIILADDGDIVDLNDGYCAMRFSYGVRVHSGNRAGGAVHTLHSDGNAYFNTSAQTPIFLVNNHSDNTKGYRIYNTSNSSVSAMFVNSSNQLVIAAGAVDQINLNKKVYVNGVALGVNVSPSATAGRIDASNDIVAYSSSDERLKYNITPIDNAIDKVKSLTGVEFDWKPEYKHAHGYEGHDTGIIAQQVQEVIPSAVRTNDTGFLAVRYEKLIGLLVEGMKEQQAQIEELKAKLDGVAR